MPVEEKELSHGSPSATLHLFPDQRAATHGKWSERVLKTDKRRSRGVVWLNARPAYCQRGEHRAYGDRSKHPFERRSGSKGLLAWVGSSFVERADEGSSFIFHPFLRPSEKRGGLGYIVVFLGHLESAEQRTASGVPASRQRDLLSFTIKLLRWTCAKWNKACRGNESFAARLW